MKITAKRQIAASRVVADTADDMREKYKQRKANVRAKRIDAIRNSDDPLDEAFNIFVPSSGPASSLGGELIRAMMRLLYRDYNDGDVFYDGYGIETCADAACFLWNNGPNTVSAGIEKIGDRQYMGGDYTNALERMSKDLVDYLLDNYDEVFKREEGEYDYQDEDGEGFIEDHEWKPQFDLDVTLPYELQRHLEEGNISDTDLQWEIESWDGMGNCDVSVESDYIYLTELDRDTYEEISDGTFYKWLEDYAQQLTDEYGDPDEEEDEEEDEE